MVCGSGGAAAAAALLAAQAVEPADRLGGSAHHVLRSLAAKWGRPPAILHGLFLSCTNRQFLSTPHSLPSSTPP